MEYIFALGVILSGFGIGFGVAGESNKVRTIGWLVAVGGFSVIFYLGSKF